MGLFLRQDEQRSDVQQRVATELQERLRNAAIQSGDVDPAFLDNQHTTRHAGIIITILIFILCAALIIFAVTIS